MVQTLIKNLDGLDDAVGRCLDARLILPALSLVFAGIDIVASLERDASEGTKAAFTKWADRSLPRPKSLPCPSLDLYPAHCEIRHTATAESDLSRTGKARKIY